MASPRRSVVQDDTVIPRYRLYDEPAAPAEPGFVHIETIASRSRPRDWTIRAHAHRDLHQLLVIRSGGGEMQAETRRSAFGAGSLLVVPAGVIHSFRFDPGTEGEIVTASIALVAPLLAEQPPVTTLLDAARIIPLAGPDTMLEAAIAILSADPANRAPLAALAAEAGLRLMLVAAVRALKAEAKPARIPLGRQAAVVARFRAQIEAWLGETVPLTRHAAAIGVSASHLRAATVNIAGAAPSNLIRDRKMIEARRMLAHGRANVASIAYALGFADPAYFSRWFARHEGRPPADYRRQCTE